ncbi:cytochrome b/b6 domain-containing protein [Sulfurisoma sediminicola]|uniref:Cytochrome b n=1 Tax=Sulfurisoma sediminicola TaxID=1381557 RepID=A0A497XBC4_9PROT|nr:cytochrome b/b6 domain-containing protein [Sulfurisoma sediminicola]RLJ63559.1 cytochrome b [Sulfurisoma sediminicola]
MCLAVPGGAEWQKRVRVWDLPTRVFHWSLVALVAGAAISGFIGGNAMVWHGRFGIAIVGLLVFRIVWGFAGSTYARFSQFVRGPAAIRDTLQGRWQGLGHNPLGALSVLGLLTVLAAQAASGLFGNDDIAFNGYFYNLVSKSTSDRLTALHSLNAWLVGALVALHLGAITFYVRVKKEDLVRPMLRGWKERSDQSEESLSGGGFVAFIVALVLALAAAWFATGTWISAPPPPPPSAAPAF